MKSYNHTKIEQKWQKQWEKEKLYEVNEDSAKKKYYPLVEFPYPSGDGLHVGHIRPYVALDIIARKRRAEGYNVLYPFGWDAFGLPTENYAIKTGIHPRIVTKKNTDNFRKQVKSIGLSFDWSREINTTDPKYYKWTQWIFLQLFKKGLAYKACMPINWCIDCKTGLANEEVVDEVCERCGGEVETREKEQWMLKITEYADRLHDDLDSVDYLEKIKIGQRNWIGRSEGAEIKFQIQNSKFKISIFTTRPDTLFGATYMVLAPEHELVQKLKENIENWDDVVRYIEQSKKKNDTERIAEGPPASEAEKTGIELKGVTAINPVNKEEIPVFVADYVLSHVGSGAIMAVPAHDERDFAFAKKYNLPIRQVIEPVYSQSTEPGKVIDGLPFDHRDAIIAIVEHWSEEKYLVLKWKQVAWGTFVTGGIEESQTPEEAAIAEIREETGYLNPKLVQDFGVLHGKFYHVPKGVNRFAHSHTLHFKLKDDRQESILQTEAEKHEPLWLGKEELKTFLTPDSHHRALELLLDRAVYTGEGMLTNSEQFNEHDSEKAKKEITAFVGGKSKTTYKLRDWIFSRQRYWGEPLPLVFCENCAKGIRNKESGIRNKFSEGELLNPGWVAIPEDQLPVELPDVKNYKPTDSGESPLAVISKWVNTKCPQCGEDAKRETDTMPNWAGSSWYYLRYTDPHNDNALADKKKLCYWIPVDWYNGGMEHTTLHLLYSRFWHKFLFDIGVVHTKEPYQKRTSHGLILAEGGEKMSKSKGNVISPDDVVANVGADTLRVYEMFMGPFEQAISWNTDNMVGSRRFLEKVWKLQERITNSAVAKAVEGRQESGIMNQKLEKLLHETIKKVNEDIENMKFNTAISALMIFVNELEKEKEIPMIPYSLFLILLSPFAPHITEELWKIIGNSSSIQEERWPQCDETKIVQEICTIVVQVNGKVRATFEVDSKTDEEAVKETALSLENIQKWIQGKKIKNTVYIKGKLINIVV